MASLTPEQVNMMVITQRVTTVFSLVGIFFILSTFLLSSSFNKPINRLVFFASWGNLGMNIATLISEAGPEAGQNAPLCQLQGFLIQMFLGVDAYWALCMAGNVYLAFFHNYTIKQLRALDPKYLLACYGFSFVPALVYLFIDTKRRGKVYGPAILWCWIDIEWDFLRIATLYGIVWIATIMIVVIYCMAGRVIWQKRDQLQGYLNPLNENPFASIITTEVRITHEPRLGSAHNEEDHPISPGAKSPEYDPYSVDIEVNGERRPSRPTFLRMRSFTREVAVNEENAEAWLYARVAFLFFVAILITWVPSSANRVYALVHPDRINFPLNYASALVFPLQGFWNVIVYIVTSQTACKHLWNSLFHRRSPSRHNSVPTAGNSEIRLGRFSRGKSARIESDTTSMKSLTNHS